MKKIALVMSLSIYLVIVFGGCLLFAGFTRGTELKFSTQNFEPFNHEIGGVASGPTADIIGKVCDDEN